MTGEYAVATDYLPTLLPELAPAWIDHVLRFHGAPPPRGGGRPAFRYLDLGCGLGVSMLALAAAYPEGRFVGVDASASHIAQAETLQARADIENAEFKAALFGDAALADLGRFDYIVANGVYGWVDDAARATFRRLVHARLAPGGALVASVNILPAWLVMQPMQRLFAGLAAAAPALSSEALVAQAKTLADGLAAAAKDPVVVAGAERFSAFFGALPPTYVAHEFSAKAWRPTWLADLAQDFAPIGLDALGGADLATLRDEYALTAAQRELLATAPSARVASDLRDIFLKRPHVHAVLRRRLPPDEDAPPPPSRRDGWARLERERDAVEYATQTPAGRLRFDNDVARTIVAELDAGAAPLSRLAAAAGASSEDAFLRVMDSLFASGQVYPVDPPLTAPAADRLNAVLRDDRYPITHLADRAGTPSRRPGAA